LNRQRRQRRERALVEARAITALRPPTPEDLPRNAAVWLLLAFLLPNLGALGCGFVLDDLPLLVENTRLHSLGALSSVWISGYWPDRLGLTLYRPVTQSVWALTWSAFGGRAAAFHGLNLLLGGAVVLLAFVLLSRIVERRCAFHAALLFALFPIHTEATTSIVGSAELLAAAFGLGALVVYFRGGRSSALLLFAAAVFAKESAAAVVGVAIALGMADSSLRRPRRQVLVDAAAACSVVGLALWARSVISRAPSFVPPVDNPMSLVDGPRRILSALWVQVLYVEKTLLPLTLSADYSYKQIPLVMGLDDPRAWAGLLLATIFMVTLVRSKELRAGLLIYGILFLPAANILFPLGTMMGERLAYLPSLGIAMLVATGLGRLRRPLPLLVVIAVLFGGRTIVRNLDWRDAGTFYSKLVVTSPESAKSHYFYGTLLASRGDDAGAMTEYDRAIEIFPAYSEAFHNRGNALARLGRREEAIESFRGCLRFDPGHAGAAANLRTLEAGLPLVPPRRPL
jgi:protein O-mannosyl-transferase